MVSRAIDRPFFFARVRQKPFQGRLTQRQVDGLSAILDGWCARTGDDGAATGRRELAYVLATAFHETAATMQPVRETLARTDAEAIRRLDAAFASGRLGTVKAPYWRRDGDHKCWFGRGLVQLTHRRNYEIMSEVTGVDLVSDPCRAMEMDVSVAILIEGMRRGSFTGHRLEDYFGSGREDWVGARKIINGRDRATLVAGHARDFARALGC
jgi:predicted chitinase